MKEIAVGLFAQVDAGKTTLSEALLYRTGQLKKLGRVDHGDAFLDHFALERSRGITIFSKQARFHTDKLSVTLLDTPGHVDFSPEAERTMQVLDYAVLIVSATDGVQGHTQTMWKLLRRYHIPTLIFFNKMDLPGADKARLLDDAKAHLNPLCADLADPEAVALCDEVAVEQYLADGVLAPGTVAAMIAQEKLFPCLFGAALKSDGVDELLRALEQYTITPHYPADFAARVYKISRDAQGNRLTFLKVTGGTLRVRALLRYLAQDGESTEEKVTQIRLYSGANFTQTEEASAGTLCAVTGISGLSAGDRLGAEADAVPPLLTPVMTYRIRLPKDADPRTVLPKLKQLEDEEPQLHIVWDERLREIHAQLTGQVQIEVLRSLIRERFELDVTIDGGRVCYRETIRNPVEGVGHYEPLRHYAEVHLILEPLPAGSGLVFATVCSEDELDRNWQRLILTHLMEKQHLGVLAGFPITDMKLTLAAGRAHLKHTEGGDFRQATYRAVRQGLMQADSVLLEPFYKFTLTVPADQIGRAINDVRAMGGSFDSPAEVEDGMQLVGRAPVSELQDYMAQVVSYTKGRGRLLCEADGYAPCHNAEQVIAEIGYDPERDLDNTPDSVFCAHGGGFTVKWDQVFSHMHLESVLRPRREDVPVQIRTQNLDLDEKELQRIMEREFGPEKYTLYRPPPKAESTEITLPPRKKDYLIVDGYNMIFAWDGLREQAQTDLSGARERLLDILSNYCGYRPCELVVVFDSYRVKGGVGSKTKHDNLRVVYTKENESADLYIETLVGKIGRNYAVRVATSDALIQLSALRSGVLRISANELLGEIEQVNEKIAAVIRQLREEAKRASIRDNPLRKLNNENTI
ncbi:MAG: TetM/TetW/TetO/TetS family tetracycline resistance ribosomal protection protein [Oscillospiraceae bacterium]|nr:TetM/TetW/TetO/TetS family tetracycline resistance ribosomal protection protein [Oscillospiraceae bacterium]